MDTLFQIVVLVFSVIVHEVSHGYAALMQGDHTAEYEGRLTLNPLKHIDPFGSVILPLLLVISHAGFVIGWAKPVPFNPYNLRNQKWGEAIVALAGPLSNIVIALIFGLVIRFGGWSMPVLGALSIIVFINLILALFNLVPIPPLDGSKILFSVLPYRFQSLRNSLERYGFFILLFFILFLWQYLFPILAYLFTLITGVR